MARTHRSASFATSLVTGQKNVSWQRQASQIYLLRVSAVGSLGCPLPQGSKDLWVRASHSLSNDCTGQRRTPTAGPLTRNLCHWSGASVNLDVTGGTTAFLLDTGATCSVLPSLDPSSLEFPPFGASPVSQFLYFTPPLYPLLDKYPFTHTCSSS